MCRAQDFALAKGAGLKGVARGELFGEKCVIILYRYFWGENPPCAHVYVTDVKSIFFFIKPPKAVSLPQPVSIYFVRVFVPVV